MTTYEATDPTFENFHFPPDDLIILCLPRELPRYDHNLAQTEAGTSNGRDPIPFAATLTEGITHIGMFVPENLLWRRDWEAPVLRFLREFCGVGRKGLSRVYILTELRAWPPFRALNRSDKKSGDWLSPWLECHMEWAMNIQEFFKETYVYIGWPEALKGTETLDRRQFWWVGSGSEALAMTKLNDFVPRNSFSAMSAFKSEVERMCQEYWGKEFDSAEFLGWIGKELRDEECWRTR
jgi:hypothetical protein